MKRKHVILIHLLFWIYLLNQAFLRVYLMEKIEPYFYHDIIIYTTLNIIFFYTLYLTFIPIIFKRKNKLIPIFITIILILIYTIFRVIVYYYYIYYFTDIPKTSGYKYEYKYYFFINLQSCVVLTIYSVFIKFTIDWFSHQKQKAELINQNQSSELALLRSQINPHFLFNTLNNIYSLVIKKSDDAAKAVMKLSSIMRYMLYDANIEKVPLEKEIEYLNSFIELQKLRIKEQDFVDFNLTGDISNRVISPMLLVPFVENAFKHGAKNVKTPGIIINLNVEPDKIIYEVTNYYVANDNSNKDNVGGIGLHNIKRRLELIYPNKYKFEMKNEDEIYIVKLEIKN